MVPSDDEESHHVSKLGKHFTVITLIESSYMLLHCMACKFQELDVQTSGAHTGTQLHFSQV